MLLDRLLPAGQRGLGTCVYHGRTEKLRIFSSFKIAFLASMLAGRPEAHDYFIPNNDQFHSDHVLRVGVSIGHTFSAPARENRGAIVPSGKDRIGIGPPPTRVQHENKAEPGRRCLESGRFCLYFFMFMADFHHAYRLVQVLNRLRAIPMLPLGSEPPEPLPPVLRRFRPAAVTEKARVNRSVAVMSRVSCNLLHSLPFPNRGWDATGLLVR
jgi:hypothetical protein